VAGTKARENPNLHRTLMNQLGNPESAMISACCWLWRPRSYTPPLRLVHGGPQYRTSAESSQPAQQQNAAHAAGSVGKIPHTAACGSQVIATSAITTSISTVQSP
jgi:hypothetical protein